jgi:hypothetical protein
MIFLAMAPLVLEPAAVQPTLWTVDHPASLDQALAGLRPRCRVTVPAHLCPGGELNLEFSALEDFEPGRILDREPYLKRTGALLAMLAEEVHRGSSARVLADRLASEFKDLPLTFTPPASDGTGAAPKITGRVDDILALVDEPSEGPSAETLAAAEAWAVQVKRLRTALLVQVFDNEDFRLLEATWRGVDLLVRQGLAKSAGRVQLWLFPARKNSFAEDRDRLLSILGPDLPNLMLADLPITASGADLDLLAGLADLADELLLPTTGWVTPEFFGLGRWSDLDDTGRVPETFPGLVQAAWPRLRKHPAADKLALTLNRFLVRPKYDASADPDNTGFLERRPPWISPVWAVGALVAQCMGSQGWPNRFFEPANFRLKGLPLADTKGDRTNAAEMVMPEKLVAGFVEAGFMPLVGPARRDDAFVPRDRALAGTSLGHALFVGRLIQFLLHGRNHPVDGETPAQLAGRLKAFISSEWAATGHAVPADLDVRVDAGRSPLVVRLTLTPPTAVLASGTKMTLSLPW